MQKAFEARMEVMNNKLGRNKKQVISQFVELQVAEKLESHKTMRKKQTMSDTENLLDGDDELEEMIIKE